MIFNRIRQKKPTKTPFTMEAASGTGTQRATASKQSMKTLFKASSRHRSEFKAIHSFNSRSILGSRATELGFWASSTNSCTGVRICALLQGYRSHLPGFSVFSMFNSFGY